MRGGRYDANHDFNLTEVEDNGGAFEGGAFASKRGDVGADPAMVIEVQRPPTLAKLQTDTVQLRCDISELRELRKLLV